MTRIPRTEIVVLVFVIAHGLAAAEQRGAKKSTLKSSVPSTLYAAPGDVKWIDGPAAFPPGAKMTLLDGHPDTPDRLFAIRIKVPANYRVMPHWHPADEHVTVISGAFRVGEGDRFDADAMRTLPTGSYFVMPARHRHYAEAREETILQLHGVGPWQMTYVNPKDDPRKKDRDMPAM